MNANLKKYQKDFSETSTSNYCTALQLSIKKEAIISCEDKNYSESCVKEAMAKAQKDENLPEPASSINSLIKKIVNSSTQTDLLKRWSEIGQRYDTACAKQTISNNRQMGVNAVTGNLNSILGTGSNGSAIQGLGGQ